MSSNHYLVPCGENAHHLGNTRVTFRADGRGSIAIDYAADYYPYAKILREYRICDPDRYLSTYHECDQETGYDNRGARLYDSEIGRFLGVDPMAHMFPWTSSYNYVLGNPVRLVDPDGRYAGEPTVSIGKFMGRFRNWGQFVPRHRNKFYGHSRMHYENLRDAKIRVFDHDFTASKQMINDVGSYTKHFGKFIDVGLPLDVKHFFRVARLTRQYPNALVRQQYIQEEYKQSRDTRPAGRTSAFSPEDLVSNELGLIFASSVGVNGDLEAILEQLLIEAKQLFTTNEVKNGSVLTARHVRRLRGIASKYYGTTDLTTFEKGSDIYDLDNIRNINDNAEAGNLPLTGTPASQE